jgi:TRAP-type C4-dicarboxylate transport system permease small subunit
VSGASSPVARLWLGLVRLLEVLAMSLFGLLTLVVLWGVFSRYTLGAQGTWTDELARYLLVWVSLIGGALMYREHGHLGVDYFVGKFDPEAQRVTAIIVELVVFGFALFVLGYGGFTLMSEAFRAGETTTSLGIQVGWLHIATPLSGIFMAAFAVEHIICGTLSYPAAQAHDEGTKS